jgi:hypothetical protein
MERLNQLLKQISEIVLKENTQREEKRRRGENFNVFKVLGLTTSEVRLHSALIAELLNPNGDHGLGSKFLESFWTDVIESKRAFKFDPNTSNVFVEYSIGTVTPDCKKGGRIDLLIRDKNKQTVIIENKIYAGDQKLQMYRYNRYATETEGLSNEQYALLYLTLFGTQPSEESTGKESFDYLTVSYKDDIIPWLEKCIGIAALYPRIRETITQYITNLKQILSIMEKNNSQEYLDVLTSNDNILTTIDILEHSYDIQTRIRTDFIDEIHKVCQNLGFLFKSDEGMKTASNFSWIHIWDEKYNRIHFVLGVRNHTNQDGFRMAFTVEPQTQLKEAPILFWEDCEKPTDEYPFGWVYLWSESGLAGSGHWWRWDEWSTLRDMANGKMVHYIEHQLNRIKEENTFERMNRLLE